MANLDFRLTAIPDTSGQELFEKEDEQLRGKELDINFQLPNGSSAKIKAAIGCNVEYLKCVLEKDHQLPYSQQVMYYNGKVMLDPLSLNDIVTDTASEVHVKVEMKL